MTDSQKSPDIKWKYCPGKGENVILTRKPESNEYTCQHMNECSTQKNHCLLKDISALHL